MHPVGVGFRYPIIRMNPLARPKKFLAHWLARPLRVVARSLSYCQYDSSAYWRARAREGSGQTRVLWRNEQYNTLVRQRQRPYIQNYVQSLSGGRVLDIGCGIGVVARMMTEMNPVITIDAVDFPEMIEIAQRENASDRICYIASSAEAYLDPDKKYSFILSSGCFSAIREIPKMERAIRNCIEMLEEGGVMLMIDPFHRWNYLARVKYSSSQVIRLMKAHKCELIERSGILFWPFREWLANADLPPERLERYFWLGERLLQMLGAHAWADYKVLAFRKKR